MVLGKRVNMKRAVALDDAGGLYKNDVTVPLVNQMDIINHDTYGKKYTDIRLG